MKAHPFAEEYPLIEGEEYETFKADIAANGQLNPIWRYEGMILDGRNRYRACLDLGIEPRVEEYEKDDPKGFVDSQNKHRRHLTAEWRKGRVAALKEGGMSNRAIAAQVGCDESTVRSDLKGSGAESPAPEQVPQVPPVATPPAAAPGRGRPTCYADVVNLFRQNLTTKEIAEELGVATGTVLRHVRAARAAGEVEQETTAGRDGRKHPARRGDRRRGPKPDAVKLGWPTLLKRLGELAGQIESMDRTTPEEESEPWKLTESLEQSAAALRRTAMAIRKRRHL